MAKAGILIFRYNGNYFAVFQWGSAPVCRDQQELIFTLEEEGPGGYLEAGLRKDARTKARAMGITLVHNLDD